MQESIDDEDFLKLLDYEKLLNDLNTFKIDKDEKKIEYFTDYILPEEFISFLDKLTAAGILN